MALSRKWTTVTPLSKAIALLMFISFPIAAFFFGMYYQRTLTEIKNTTPPAQTACTLEAKVCTDGTTVGREGPDCEFAPCPGEESEGAFCGGIAGVACPAGYNCKLDGNYPDAGGTCVR